MTIRTLAALVLLALPMTAQDPKGSTTTDQESIFFKAFYLERGARAEKEALDLYQQFLAAAPSHKYSKQAAQNALGLFNKAGNLEEASKFKKKYETLLKDASDAAAPAGDRRPGEGAPPAAGERRAGGGLQALRDELAKAKEAGDEKKVKELEEQIKAREEGRRGAGGQGQPGGRRGMGGGIFSDKKITEMNDEELGALKTGMGNMSRMLDMMRNNGQAETADKLEKLGKKLSEQLEAGKKEDAEKTREEMRAAMPRRGGG